MKYSEYETKVEHDIIKYETTKIKYQKTIIKTKKNNTKRHLITINKTRTNI